MVKAVSVVFVGGSVSDIAGYLVIALIAVFLRGYLTRVMESYSKVMAAKVKNKIHLMIFDKILRLGPSYLNNKRLFKNTSFLGK